MPELPKAYDHSQVEDKIYKQWMDSGYFNPDKLPDADKREPYTIIMPPPNVTGTLHIGHALFVTIQDILIRWERMRGKKALWLPGTDHAAIATQSKVEADLYKKEGKTKADFSREEFLKLVENFAQASHDTIVNQLKRMGASTDWSREAYTLDEKRNFAVKTAFKRMYDDGIIYRGARIVNWDPKLKTTVSDDEIEYKEQTDPFYHFKYGPFDIGTVRPETKFGDKYVVMHPKDKRYAQFKHGQQIDLEWINGPITATIIKDEAADMSFGSGVMTITPAHSGTDFDIAKRHGLDIEQVIDERGVLLPIAGEFAGQHIKKARAAIVEKLKNKGLVTKVDENYVHNVATNSRGGGIIEPQIKEQWFVDVNREFPMKKSAIPGIKTGQMVTLKQLMRHVVQEGLIKIIPEHFSKIYFHWIDNLRDWCISRQIWYGHRVPVWYKTQIGSDMEMIHFEESIICKKFGLTNERELDKYLTDLLQQSNWKDKNIQWGSNRDGVIQLYIGLIDLLKQKGFLEEAWIKENRIARPQKPAEIYVGINPPEEIGWYQDPDTLDTWFSSGLWTFSTLGWPSSAKASEGGPDDLSVFHPTDVLETGYDILFFWVARMILMTTYHIGDVPFRTVYLHGLVRDKDRQKMSKTKGNVIDPLGVTEIYGTDALRFALVFSTSAGNDIPLAEDKIKGMKHFANKLWNITRFILANSEPVVSPFMGSPNAADKSANYTEADRNILNKIETVIKSCTNNLENFRLHEAAQEIYHFVWHEFADIYIEASKKQLADEKLKETTYHLLLTILIAILKLLHPFMPFITEHIWLLLKEQGIHQEDLLMVQNWPQT